MFTPSVGSLFYRCRFLTVDWIDNWNHCKCDYTTNLLKGASKSGTVDSKQWPNTDVKQNWWKEKRTEQNRIETDRFTCSTEQNRIEHIEFCGHCCVRNMRLFSLFYSVYLLDSVFSFLFEITEQKTQTVSWLEDKYGKEN